MQSITIKNRISSISIEPPDRDGEIEIRIVVHARTLSYYATPEECNTIATALMAAAGETVKQRTT